MEQQNINQQGVNQQSVNQQYVNQQGVNSELHNKILTFVYDNNGYIYGSYVYNYILKNLSINNKTYLFKNRSFNDINIAIPKYMFYYRKIDRVEEPIIDKFMENCGCEELQIPTQIFDRMYKCPNGLVYTVTRKERVNKYINTDKTDIVYGKNGLYHKRYPHSR